MCPMSPLTQIVLITCSITVLCAKALNNTEWNIACEPKQAKVLMYESINVTCDIQGPEKVFSEHMLLIQSVHPDVAGIDKEIWLKKEGNGTQYGPESFNINGVFIGETNITVKIRQRHKEESEAMENVHVIVIREKTVLDIIFHVSVILLVSLMYVNFGCAFNWGALRDNLRRPVAPLIGFGLQIIFMPLLSFALGRLLFPGNHHMQLGMFFTGIAPSGGASNMWTILLGGNLELSITMTTMINLAAFGTMPFWVFTLGQVIYNDGNMIVPYKMILNYSLCLMIPLLVGYLLQRFCRKVSDFMVRILKGLSATLLAFIIIFAIVTNTYIFELFSWRIILAGMGLPWIAYIIAYVCARLLGRNEVDGLTIAIETGIQNTGIAIYLLKTTLEQPASDLTTVVPVAAAVMMPFPLLGMYVYKLVQKRMDQKECKKDSRNLMESSPLNSPMSELLDNDNNFNVTGPKTQAKLKLDDNYFTTMDLQCNI